MRQRKKEREALKRDNVIGQPEMEKRLTKQFDKAIEFRNNNKADVKISDVVSQMIRPLMQKARSFKEEQNIVGMGVMAWNLGILKTFKGEDEMLKSMEDFKMFVPEEYKKILMEYAEIKCTRYAKYDQFIYDYELKRIDSNNNNLSLAYKSFNE